MYNPISVEFFDQLQVAMQRKIPSKIIYIDDLKEKETKGIVKTMKLKNHKEFLVLHNSLGKIEEIALENVLSFNGKVHKKISDFDL